MESRALVKMVLSTFSDFRVASVFLYGNRQGRDADLFVLLEGDNPYIRTQEGNYDITAIGSAWQPILIKYRDPLIVEPVLEGLELLGSIAQVVKEQITSSAPDSDCPDYLCHCSSLFFSWAVVHEREGNFSAALETLRFAASYALLARHYETSGEICLFQGLLEANPSLRSLNNSLKTAHVGKTKQFLERVRGLLTEYGVLL